MNRITKLIHYIKDYRIHVTPGSQFRGIKDTLLGWAIIAFTFIIRKDITDPLELELVFFIIYLTGAIGIAIYILYNGILRGNVKESLKILSVSKNSDTDISRAHLSVSQRIKAIYIRGIIATTGWLGVNIASIYFGYVDNSAIFNPLKLAS